MKSRRSQRVLNLMEKGSTPEKIICPKPDLKRNPSYECVIKDTPNDSENIPKLIIKKKMANKAFDTVDNNIEKIPLMNQWISDKSLENKKANEQLLKPCTQISKLPHSVISDRLLKLSKYSNFINCEKMFENLAKIDLNGGACWNELYAPKTVDNFLTSQSKDILKFKKWLGDWGKQSNTKNSKANTYSDSDFENDWNDSSELKQQSPLICIIRGSFGSGKSSLVYTIAAELNYHVFEMNCSNRRTGKDVLDKLENAASNQHVKVTRVDSKPIPPKPNQKSQKRKSLMNFFEPISKKAKLIENPMKQQNSSMMKPQNSSVKIENNSLFLFDDVEVVMEEDKGFWGGVCSLIDKQSRPIVLTATDVTELQKFLHKIGKNSYLTVNLDRISSVDIAVYLQLILLSRGYVLEHCDVLQWMRSFPNGANDLRFCLNNMQFDFAGGRLALQNRTDWLQWNGYQLNRLGDDDDCVVLPDGENSRDKSQPTKPLCTKALRCLNTHFRYLCDIDSQIPKRYRNCAKNSERDSVIDRFPDTSYDSNESIAADISETLMTLYNKCLHKSLTTFETSTLSTSPTVIPSQLRKSASLRYQFINDTQTRVTNSIHIRSAVAGTRDRLDRLNTLKTMASSEQTRKDNCTKRRFLHYFDRSQLRFAESDLKYLLSKFK